LLLVIRPARPTLAEVPLADLSFVGQLVISVPKRFRFFLAGHQSAVAALTGIFIEEIERLRSSAAYMGSG
jgi:hypothetical protein